MIVIRIARFSQRVAVAAWLVLCMLASSPTLAITTMGDRTCGQWVAQRKDGAVQSWLAGYLSGLAVAFNNDALAEPDGESIFLWMDNYCAAHPLDRVATGGRVLFDELSQRIKGK
jgi:hypothetical protein